jgi:DNA-binding response OmpR family regulator
MTNDKIMPRPPPVLRRVLLLETDPQALVTLGHLLSAISLDAFPTASCAAARYAAGTVGPFDIFIADAELPDGSGIDLASALRAQQGCATIIMSSVNPPDGELPAGINRWLVKPVGMPQLEDAIRTLCHG